MIKNQFRNKMR